MKLLWIALALALFTGFANPTIDASSMESLAKSAKEVKASLNDSEAKELDKALMYYSLKALQSKTTDWNSDEESEAAVQEAMSELSGLTGQEVLKRYRAERDSSKS